jgi:hypothetical protein
MSGGIELPNTRSSTPKLALSPERLKEQLGGFFGRSSLGPLLNQILQLCQDLSKIQKQKKAFWCIIAGWQM